MPASWKKVVVSGSTPNFANIQVDGLTSGQVVIGGGSAGNLTSTAVNGTGNIVATTGATGLVHSGSFSGSFLGTATTASYITSSFFTGTNAALSSSYALTASFALAVSGTITNAATASYVTSSFFTGINAALSASYATRSLRASYASTAGAVATLTLGNGLTGTSFNGSTAVTAAVGAGALITVSTGLTSVTTSSLSANQIPKFSNNTLSGSNISDTGTQVTIAAGATSGLSVAAGGINVTGNSTFNNAVTITGDLTVAGTASFTNTDNLNVKDKFILINSGSATLADSGWVTQYNAAGSGSAFFLEAGSTGPYGRFAVAYDIIGTSTSIAADEYVVTAKLSAASAPSNTVSSSWGSTNSGGNMWIKQDTGDIYIWA